MCKISFFDLNYSHWKKVSEQVKRLRLKNNFRFFDEMRLKIEEDAAIVINYQWKKYKVAFHSL